jgi:hypothetical protein
MSFFSHLEISGTEVVDVLADVHSLQALWIGKVYQIAMPTEVLEIQQKT